MKWQYGVTTVPQRFSNTLPRTLESLARGGFDHPVLFVDGCAEEDVPEHLRAYPVTVRPRKLRTLGNWILAAWELYLRDPHADRYGIFQDDCVTYRNLRQYLEACDLPKTGYWNLYTFPENEKPQQGWYLSNQMGRGAVGTVYSNEGIRLILGHRHFIDRPRNKKRGHKSIDGGIVTSFRKAGWKEWVHNPSLLQHIGEVSSIGNRVHEKASTFQGEDFDALTLLRSSRFRETGTRRIGLVGYNCDTGLGELNRQLATYCDIDTWLVKPHGRKKTREPHPDVDTIVCRGGEPEKLARFIRSVDVVVFCETPYYTRLIPLAKQHKRRVVCIPMIEWLPNGAWTKDVDLFVCPTQQCYDMIKDSLPAKYFPWPVDIDRFEYRQRTTCEEFLFINGNGGWQGRKGASVIREALEIWPELPLVVRTQKPLDLIAQFLPRPKDNSCLYNRGDVLICPHTVDGLGLEPLEAKASGLPVISTDGPPWNEYDPLDTIPAKSERRMVKRMVHWHKPSARGLVEICQSLLGQDIAKESEQARKWAELRRWSIKAPEIERLIRTGEHKVTMEIPVQ